jgi:hypothetical protein
VLVAPSSGAGPVRDTALHVGMAKRAAALAVDISREGHVAIALGALLVVLLVLPVVRAREPVAVLLLATAALVGLVPTVISGDATGRYTGTALTFVAMAAVAAVRGRPLDRTSMVSAAGFLAAVLLGFGVLPDRTNGTSWKEHVRDARPACAATGRARIPVVPERKYPAADLRC